MKNFSIANKYIKVEINGNAGSVTLSDLKSGIVWKSRSFARMCYGNEYVYDLVDHCRTRIKKEQNSLVVRFDKMFFWARFKNHGYVKPDPGPELEFEFSISLEDDHAVFRIEKIKGMDDEECRINFPCGLVSFDSTKSAEVLIPCHFGNLFTFPRKDFFNFKYGAGMLDNTIPIQGVFTPAGGLGIYQKTPFDSLCEFDSNNMAKGKAFLETSFVFEKKNANYPRELHFYPFAAGENYVGLAKLYRKILKSEKRFVSLEDKICQNTDVEKLVGSVIWKHNVYSNKRPAGIKKSYSLYMMHHAQNEYEGLPSNWTAKEIFDTAKKKGFDRVCVYNTGWNNMGFDSGYPTRMPPNPERGTIEDFRNAAEYARKLSKDYIYSVHDNYFDIYKNSPEFNKDYLGKHKNGSLDTGGIWRGGRAFVICSSQSLGFAKRDIPEIAKMVGKGSIYVDVLGCAPLRVCHDPKHPQGKKDDAASRRKVLEYIKKIMGSIATEGVPGDYLADTVDLGAFAGIYLREMLNPQTAPLPVPVPFWQLVYHDSILNYTSESTFGAYGSEYILYVALFGMLPTQLDEVSKKLSCGLRSAYKSEMISHEFLKPAKIIRCDDGSFRTSGVARTVFADGTSVIANFNEKPFVYKGNKIKGRDFVILNGIKKRANK